MRYQRMPGKESPEAAYLKPSSNGSQTAHDGDHPGSDNKILITTMRDFNGFDFFIALLLTENYR